MKKVLYFTLLTIVFVFNSCLGKGFSEIGIEQNQRIYDQSYKLDWQDIKNSEGYLIEISTTKDFSEISVSETVDSSEAELGIARQADIRLSENDYYIRIKPLIKGTEWGSWSDKVFFHYYPLELSISIPVDGTHYSQNQPFKVTYTTATLGAGTTQIQVADDRSFENLIYTIDGEQGKEVSVEIPGLDAGNFYLRAVFTDPETGTWHSFTKDLIMEYPVLWAKLNYDALKETENSIIQILSNGEIISEQNITQNNIYMSSPIEVDGKRVLWLQSVNESFFTIQTEENLLRQITPEKIQEGKWKGIDSGNNSIYLSGFHEAESGSQAAILQLNPTGIQLKEITLDPVVKWPEAAIGTEWAGDVQVVNDSLYIAGHSKTESGEKAVWIAQTDMDGSILRKAQYISPDKNQDRTILNFISETENGPLYFGSIYDYRTYEMKPVLLHYIIEEKRVREISLLAQESELTGDALWIEETSTLIVAWGSFLYKYTISTDATELDPLAIKEISLSDNGSDSKLEIFLEDLQLSNGQIIVSGSSQIIPIFSSSWIAGISESLNSITWQTPEDRSNELVIEDYNINFMKYGEDWAPWKTNARADEDTSEYDLVYKPDGQQMGLIRPIDGPEIVFGEILDQHPPIREASDWAKIWEVEGVYLIGNESHAYLNIITNPDWELRNGLHVGMNSDDASRIMSGFKALSDEDDGWISAPNFIGILPDYTGLEGYYNAEGPGGIAVLLFFAEGELVAFVLEAMM